MSNQQLQDKVINLFKTKFPITNGKYVVDIEDLEIKPPTALGDIKKEYELKAQGKNLAGTVKGRLVLKEKGKNKIIDQTGKVEFIGIPFKSARGTYIVGGQEKVVSNLLRSKPGPYTALTNPNTVKTQIMFANYAAPKIEMELDTAKSKFTVNVGGTNGKNFPGIKFLRYVGATDAEIRNAIGRDELADRLMANENVGGQGTLKDLFGLIVNHGKFSNNSIKYPQSEASAILMIQDALANNANLGEDGTEVAEVNIGHKGKTFDKRAVLLTVKKTFDVARGEAEQDDRDELVYQNVLTGEDYIYNLVEKDVDKFVKEVETVFNNKKISYATPAIKRLGKSLDEFMTTGQLVENVEETNPLHLFNSFNKVTMLGEGGGIGAGAKQNADKQRNLKSTAINRLDPVHTPESTNIGLINYLAQDADIKNKTILTKAYKVKGGKAKKNDSNLIEISPKDEMQSYIAFNDPRYVEDTGTELVFKSNSVPARYRGQNITVDVSKIQYIDRAPQNLFGIAANLVPFGHHNDGNRMLMGANMQTQAVNLINREEPLVQVVADKDKGITYEEILGDKAFTVKAPIDGTVVKVEGDNITIKDDKGKEHKVDIYDYFPLNRGNFINNEPVVKPGDKVKSGQLLAEGWQTRGGKLALGANARVGYMPYKGYNYEDGIVVSESFANKMSTEETYVRDYIIRKDHIGGPGSNVKQLAKEYINPTRSLDKLDQDGIIRVGSEVGPGDIVVERLKIVDADKLDQGRSLYNKLMGNDTVYREAPGDIPKTGYTKGKVIRVETLSGSQSGEPDAKYVIRVTIATSNPLKLGDKLSGRHGNKGTVTKILPDKEMPYAEDGNKLDLMFSPLAVPSRKNLGQLLEVNAGLIAEKKGQPFKVVNFDPSAKDEVLKGLKEIGVPDGKMKVIDPETGKPLENPVTVGDMYVMKLKHKVDDKIQGRSNIEDPGINLMYLEPRKDVGNPAGEKHNPQRLGEMEMWALQGHKAVHNILESTTLKGDGAGDVAQRFNIFRALSGEKKFHDLADYNGTPESLNILHNYLVGMGLQMTPLNNGKRVKSVNDTFDEMLLTPMKKDEMIKLIGQQNEVVAARKFAPKLDAPDKAEKGGLFDPDIFGDDKDSASRNKWGYIKLVHPIPNPVFVNDQQYNPYSELTPFSANEIKKIMQESVVVIINPGDTPYMSGEIVPAKDITKLEGEGKMIDYKAGGEAIMHYLKKVNLDKELRETETLLKDSKGKDRDKLYRKYKILNSLKKNNLKPEDLMLEVVPVIPAFMRPRMQQGKNVVTNDLNKLYSEIIKANNDFKNTLGKPYMSTAQELGEDSSFLYKTVDQLYGTSTQKYRDRSTKREIDGFKDKIGGKEGLVHKRMLGKRLDFSGRAVIGVDPQLKLNEVGIPSDMARDIYKPFIIKELVQRGDAINYDQAGDMVKDMHPKAKEALERVVRERPVILNRQPSLHKFSMQAFQPKISDYDEQGNPIRTVQLNPLVVTGFNADFDGDQMGVHVPLTDKAVKEAKKLMMPSNNLINPTNGEMIVEIRHEMLLGVYYLTMNADKPIGKNPIVFNTYEELRKAYRDGKIKSREKATLSGVTSTAGQLLFNFLIPDKYKEYRVFGKTMAKKEVKELLKKMYDDKRMSTVELSDFIDDLKDLGFEASTRSGLSIGVTDFKNVDFAGKKLDEIVKSVDSAVEKKENLLIAGVRELEEDIADALKSGKIYEQDNPIQVMMHSGARGDANQIRRMSTLVGVGVDLTGKPTAPVLRSHLDGLSPQEYWLHSYDSRKGMYDRVVSTSKPGALTKKIIAGNQDVIVREKDCGTTEGISISKKNKTIIGRFAAQNITNASGKVIVKRNEIIDKIDYEIMYNDDSIGSILVRSPMTCRTVNGVCQKCYGELPGTNQLAEIGEPVGILATQAFGEPVTQMTMNTFHSGGTNSNATQGLPRIEEIINASNKPNNKAILAERSGVARVEKKNGKTVVYIDSKPHHIDLGPDGKEKPLRIKDGDYVNKGDFLTAGTVEDMFNPQFKTENIILTNADPSQMLKLKSDVEPPEKALKETQDYLANSMDYAFKTSIGDGKLDRRHIEVTIGRLTSKVTITDPGSSNYMPGQVIERAEVERWNANNASPLNAKPHPVTDTKNIIGSISGATYKDKNGIIVREGETITREMLGRMMIANAKSIKIIPKPIKYEVAVNSLQNTVTMGHDNWLSNLGYQDARKQIARGAALGQSDKIDSVRSRQMTGNLLNIGEGFNLLETLKDKANSFKSSLLNMFQ